MSLRNASTRRRHHAVAGMVALFCLVNGKIFAEPGQPIQFSSPHDGLVVSNLNQLRHQKSGVKELEEDVSRSFESLDPGSSLGPVITRPYRPTARPTVRNKHDKKSDDLRKDWAFRNPNDLTKGPTAEEIFGLKAYDKNGQEKKHLSTFEKYYQSLDHKRERDTEGKKDEDDTDSDTDTDKNASSFLRSKDRLDTFGDALNNADPLLKGLSDSDSDIKMENRSTSLNSLPFSGIGKIDAFQTSRDSARDARMEGFKQLLGSQAANPTADSLNRLSQQSDPTRSLLNPAKNFDTYSGASQRDSLNSLPNGLNFGTAFQPGILQDVNARPFGQPSLLPGFQPSTLPKAQPPPNFNFPTRKF